LTAIGDGPPVILCHGTPWSSYVWRTTTDALSRHHTVYLWDMLGYGESDQPDTDVSLETQGHLLAALVDHWHLTTPDVVAHDYGGAVALRAHLLHGMEVRSLALIDVVALSPWGSEFFRLVASHADVFSRLPGNLHEALVREYIAGASHRGLSADVHEALIAPWLGDRGQPAYFRQIAQADERYTDEIEPDYAGISVPTLVVWGADDEWIPIDRARRLHDLIPDSTLHVLEDCGHLAQEDQPNRLNALLADWLSAPT